MIEKLKADSNRNEVILPHFIIAGAMKCGTSSLHHILASHPEIFIPEGEIHFYDMDDILQHNDFFMYEDNKRWYPDFEKDINKYLQWYSSFFDEAPDDKILGEDSTTYIASDIAAKRISEINPSAKIIVMLRDPTARTYSHYWHLFRTGRATKSFEESIRNESSTLITRSLYKKQIANFIRHISPDRIHFISFENFIENTDRVIKEVLTFLCVDAEKFTLNEIDTHKNKTTIPRSIKIQLFRNSLIQNRVTKMTYFDHLPFSTPPVTLYDRFIYKLIKKTHRLINPQATKNIPPMRQETRSFLNSYFQYWNSGIDELVGFDIDKNWYK